MRSLFVLLISTLAALQDPAPSIEQLIERLRSAKVEERARAEQALILRGEEAVPGLKRAAEDSDAEVAARARVILAEIPLLQALTPNLEKVLPGSRLKLVSNFDHAWTTLFLEATKQEGSRRSHPELGREDLLPLARLALRGAARTEVAAVCGAIAAWQLQSAVPALVSQLDEQDENIRLAVFDAVEACRPRDLATPLLERYRQDQSILKPMWLGVLAKIGCREIGPEIAAGLQAPPGSLGGWAFHDWAAEVDALDGVPALLKILRQEQYGIHEALSALLRMAPEELLSEIRSDLGSADTARRVAALNFIDRYYSARSLLSDIQKVLDDPHPALREKALIALGNLRLRDQISEFKKRLEDPAPRVRRTAAGILASFGDRAGLPELVLQLGMPEGRGEALDGIRRLGAREASPDILPLLKVAEVKGATIETLAALGAEDVRPIILEMLQDPDANLRASAVIALTSLEGPKAISKILPLLDDPDFNVKHNRVPQMLQLLKAKEAVPKFREWMKAEDAGLRSSGLWYFTVLAPDEALPVLMKALDDREPGMRLYGVEQLGRMRTVQAVPQFRVLLRDPDVKVRQAAAAALVRVGDREGLPLVLRSPRHSPGWFEVNLFRNPEICKSWKTKVLSGPPITGTTLDVLEEVARRSGIILEVSPNLMWSSWVNEHQVQGRDLLSVISDLVTGTGGAVVEEGRLRVLSPRDSFRFWTRWWAEELLKSDKPEDLQEGRWLLADLDVSESRLIAWSRNRAAAALAPNPADMSALLTPALKAIPGLEQRLLEGGDTVWAREFAWISDRTHLDEYRGILDSDLDVLAPRALLGSLTASEKVKTLQIIATRHLKGVEAQVRPLLKDLSAAVRVAAARACLALEGANALSGVYPLLEDPDPSVRTGTVEALGKERRVEARPRLVDLLGDPAIGAGLLTAAGELDIPEAIPLLFEAAKGPRRQDALLSLRTVGGPAQGRQLAALIRTEPDWYALSKICWALGFWGTKEAVPDLIWLLDNPGPVGRDSLPDALRALSRLGAREAAPAILIHLNPGQVIPEAASIAAEMDLREALPQIRALAASENRGVARFAAKALGEFADKDSIPLLRKLLHSSDASVRTSASMGLAMLGDRESIPRIIEITRDGEGGYRDSLTPLLYFVPAGTRQEFLVNFKTESHMATPAMAEVFGEDLLPMLVPLLRKPNDPGTRRNAMCAAGRIPGDAALAEIRRMLNDPYDDARYVASEMLCRRGLREGVPVILENFVHQWKFLPFELNAVRKPDVWKRLREKELRSPVYASARDLIAMIAKEAGLSFEEPTGDMPDRATWTNYYQCLQEWGRPLTLLEALDRIRHWHWMIILEDGRIRIVPKAEALEFWKQWWVTEKR